jgi:hypothetical protein
MIISFIGAYRNQLAEAVTLLTRIRKMSDSNLGWDITYAD